MFFPWMLFRIWVVQVIMIIFNITIMVFHFSSFQGVNFREDSGFCFGIFWVSNVGFDVTGYLVFSWSAH